MLTARVGVGGVMDAEWQRRACGPVVGSAVHLLDGELRVQRGVGSDAVGGRVGTQSTCAVDDADHKDIALFDRAVVLGGQEAAASAGERLGHCGSASRHGAVDSLGIRAQPSEGECRAEVDTFDAVSELTGCSHVTLHHR